MAFAVSVEEADLIHRAWRHGEDAGVAELRRLFPYIADNANARGCARTIAAWTPLPEGDEVEREIEALHRAGLTYREIAQRSGQSLSAVGATVLRLQAAGVLAKRARSYRVT